MPYPCNVYVYMYISCVCVSLSLCVQNIRCVLESTVVQVNVYTGKFSTNTGPNVNSKI